MVSHVFTYTKSTLIKRSVKDISNDAYAMFTVEPRYLELAYFELPLISK